MKILKTLFSILFSVLLIANVNASEKWDMALAYGASNFHSANAAPTSNFFDFTFLISLICSSIFKFL